MFLVIVMFYYLNNWVIFFNVFNWFLEVWVYIELIYLFKGFMKVKFYNRNICDFNKVLGEYI